VRATWHLVPQPDWDAADSRRAFEPRSLADEGFVHCTDGDDELIATANRHYADDRRPFLALALDLDAVGSPWRYDEPGRPYPHIYGPIARAAVNAVFTLRRDDAGRFEGIGPPPD
jgi:uncharacterized protein (DUF952 family)